MRKAIPPIHEHVDDLKQRLQREHDGHKKPRLQMLDLLTISPIAANCSRLISNPSELWGPYTSASREYSGATAGTR